MAAALRLRLRGPEGKQQTCNLPADASVGDLRREASSTFSLIGEELELLLGFPPAACTAATESPLTGLVRSGDTVVVRKAGGPTLTQAPAGAAPPGPSGAAAATAAASAPAPLPSAGAPGAAKPQPPPTAGQGRGAGIATLPGQGWDCPLCTLYNEPGAAICAACESPAPAGTGGARGGSGGGNGSIPPAEGAAALVKMPDDNSCLFHGIVYLLDPTSSQSSLRQSVAREVRENPSRWDDATLGKPRSEYIDFILNPIRWGGQVELAIFSSLYKAEIAVAEVQSGRCDVFGEGSGYSRRVYLVHSGLHFDAVSFGPKATREVAPASFASSAAAVKALTDKLRAEGSFVDQDTMRLRCKICGYIANGDYEARAHAGGTGHKEFARA